MPKPVSKLRLARLVRGLTQKELAKLVEQKTGEKISIATLAGYETGERCPSIKAAFLLASTLEEPIEELFDDFRKGNTSAS